MKPILICLTPIRNEAWVLHAFLKATSLWADYIIIADQMSTDGSREIALSYPKVILIDNFQLTMHQAETRKLLFSEAQKIKGKKVLFTLDADEFLSGNFQNTENWNRIINSSQGDVFFFKWINLCENPNESLIPKQWMYWASTVEIDDFESHFPNNYIHEWRLPYPNKNANEIYIDDIYFIHLARVNYKRQNNKNIFYQVITLHNEPRKSLVSLFRMYHSEVIEQKIPVKEEIYSFYDENRISILNEINIQDEGKYYLNEVSEYFNKDGIKLYAGLYIWNKNFLENFGINDPRNFFIKLLHLYLNSTRKYSNTILIKVIDKILKKIGI